MSDEVPLLGWLDGVGLEAATGQRLFAFSRDVLRFNRSQNLVSRKSSTRQLNAMIWEAVAVSEILAPTKRRSLDLGSGAGFPGIPLAILRPEEGMDLLERRGSRCEFLRREKAALGIPTMEIIEGDAERLAELGAYRGRYARVWLKAVAEPVAAFRLARPFLESGGCALILRSSNWNLDKELGDLVEGCECIALPPEPSGAGPADNALHILHI